MRRLLHKELIDIMNEDKDVVLIIGGVGDYKEIEKRFPARFYDVGALEQTMIGMSAGMALQGMKPYLYTITPFLIERPFEQVKLYLNEMKTNVNLFGYAEYPLDGITHQTPNIKEIMNLFKNIKSFYPETKEEFLRDLNEMKINNGPCFMRLKNV